MERLHHYFYIVPWTVSPSCFFPSIPSLSLRRSSRVSSLLHCANIIKSSWLYYSMLIYHCSFPHLSSTSIYTVSNISVHFFLHHCLALSYICKISLPTVVRCIDGSIRNICNLEIRNKVLYRKHYTNHNLFLFLFVFYYDLLIVFNALLIRWHCYCINVSLIEYSVIWCNFLKSNNLFCYCSFPSLLIFFSSFSICALYFLSYILILLSFPFILVLT